VKKLLSNRQLIHGNFIKKRLKKVAWESAKTNPKIC